MSYREKTKSEALENVKTKVDTVNGKVVVVKVYPEAGKRNKQLIKCKG